MPEITKDLKKRYFAKLDTDGSFLRQLNVQGNTRWSDGMFCTIETLCDSGYGAEFGIVEIYEVEPPKIDEISQVAINDGAALVDGRWQYNWRVEQLSQEQVEANLIARKSSLSMVVRAKRDALLSECDWTQVLDAPIDRDLWSNYRQALRDIPQQAGFPETVVWPVKP